MPKKQTQYKYKCLELMCNSIIRHDKWVGHCKMKHAFKFRNNIDVKFKITEVKTGGVGPWKPYIDKTPTVNDPELLSTRPLPAIFNLGETSTDKIVCDDSASPQNSNSHLETVKEPRGTTLCCNHNKIAENATSTIESENHHLTLNETPSTAKGRISDGVFNRESPSPEDHESNHEINSVKNSEDPASYANLKLSPEDINLAMELENQDLTSFNFPSTNGRKFNPSWKNTLLPNKKGRPRKWLVYSQKKDAIFCLPCTLFSLPTERSIWGTTGYRGWTEHRGDRDIVQHEISKHHLSAEIARVQWISKMRIDYSIAEQSDKVVNHNREVLSVIIDCCRYLSEEMLGFRKKDSVKGKLFGLFKLIGKYNPDARVYIEKIERARTEKVKLSSNFLSYRNVFDLINLMSDIVVSKITMNINMSNTYSVILDSELVDAHGFPKLNVRPVERLIKVFPSGDTTGGNLFRELMKCLKSLGIDPSGIVGQSMDGAGNMRGKHIGLKTLITKECPKAFYVWCSSHRFALVVEKTMDVSSQMKNMFLILEELYVFMSGHKRHHLLAENLEAGPQKNRKRSLKRVQTTRWSSRNDALQTVIKCFDTIKQTLLELCTDTTSDSETKAKAKGLYKQITDYENLCTMQIALAIFKLLSPVTVCMQSKTIDYSIIPKMVTDTKDKLATMRKDSEWEKMERTISAFAEEHNVPQPTCRIRNRKRKRFMDEMAIDERIEDPLKRMKVEVYLKVIDSLTNQLSDRFPEESLAMVSQMGIFSHEGILNLSKEKEKGLKFTSSKVKDLCEFYSIDEEKITEEMETFIDVYKVTHTEIDISDCLLKGNKLKMTKSDDESESEGSGKEDETFEEDLTRENKKPMHDNFVRRGFIRPYRCILNMSAFPNLNMLYDILLSLPVTSCSAERAMSKIKIVKNRLRSSMGDDWLSSLLILSSESDILQTIPNEEIINKFACTSDQRKKLLRLKS